MSDYIFDANLSDYDNYKNRYHNIEDTEGLLAAAEYLCTTEAPETDEPDCFFLNVLKDSVDAMTAGEMNVSFSIPYTMTKVMCQVMPSQLDLNLLAKAILLTLDQFDNYKLRVLTGLITTGVSAQSPVREALELATTLKRCRFTEFWATLAAYEPAIAKAANVNAIRHTIAKVISISCSAMKAAPLKAALNNPSDQEMKEIATALMMTESVSGGEALFTMTSAAVVSIASLDGQDVQNTCVEDIDQEEKRKKYMECLKPQSAK